MKIVLGAIAVLGILVVIAAFVGGIVGFCSAFARNRGWIK